MPTDALPTAAIWDDFKVAGIVFIVILAMVILAWKAFREYRAWQTAENQAQRKWQDEQFDKRELENEKQRTWNEEMERRRSQEAATRDEQMRTFMAAQQKKQIEADQETSRVLNSLVSRIDGLTAVMAAQSKALSDHDAKVDQRFAAAAAPKRRGSG